VKFGEYNKRLFKKDVRSRGGRDFVQCRHFAEEALQLRASALLGKTLRIFRNLQCVRTDRGGGWSWASADITKGGRVKFLLFCANVFYGTETKLLT